MVDWAAAATMELGAQVVPWFTGIIIPELGTGITKLLPQDALLNSANGEAAAIRQINEEKLVKQMLQNFRFLLSI